MNFTSSELESCLKCYLSFPLEGKKLEPGKYTLTMNVRSSKEKWSFTKDFGIKSEVAKSLNDKDVTIKKSNNVWLYILLVSGVFVSIILIFIFLEKKNK
ncbi:WxL protein host-binding domain-containing protein [Enterococcus sp. DIV1444a]|uniref:WxL protein host-binding domain-containing protein n=1 Tax=Enterococcus sp. DIV1444a TaxID=2774679 RepID=UPI003F6835C3